MSVRAYRIITKKLAKTPSFNLWHNAKLISYWEKDADCSFLVDETGGMACVTVKTLKKSMKDSYKLCLDEYQYKAFKADLAWAKRNKTDYITYECY